MRNLLTLLLLTSANCFGQLPKLVLPQGHTKLISDVCISSDGTKIATSAGDGLTKIWEANHGKLLLTIETCDYAKVDFSPDGNRLVVCNKDEPEVWDLVKNVVLFKLKSDHEYINLAKYSPDGTRIFTFDLEKGFIFWNAANGKEVSRLPIVCMDPRFSSDGKRLLSKAGVFDIATSKLLFEFSPGDGTMGTEHFGFSQNGNWAWGLTSVDNVIVWNANTGVRLCMIENTNRRFMGVTNATVSNDGALVVLNDPEKAGTVWSTADGHKISEFNEPYKLRISYADYLLFSPNNDFIVVATEWKQQCQIWKCQTGEKVAELQGHQSNISSVAMTNDGSRLVTGSWDCRGKLWNLNSGVLIAELNGGIIQLNALRVNPCSTQFLTRDDESEISVWNAVNGVIEYAMPEISGKWRISQYSPDGKNIFLTSSKENQDLGYVCNASTGQIISQFEISEYVVQAAFSPDGNRIAFVEWGRTLQIRDANSGVLIAEHSSEHYMDNLICFSPDGKTILAIDDLHSILVDAQTAQILLVLPDHPYLCQFGFFSKDGQSIFLDNGSNGLEIRSAIDGTLVNKIVCIGTEYIENARLSPDGQKLCIITDGGGSWMWSTNDLKLLWRKPGVFQIYSGSYTIEFSPDGSNLLTSFSQSRVFWVQNTSNGKIRFQVEGHTDVICGTSFIDSGTKILSASEDGTVKMWNANDGKIICMFLSTGNGEYITWVPRGYYQCSPNASKTLHYVTDSLKVISFDQLDIRFNRPDIILKSLGCTNQSQLDACHQAYMKRIKKLGIDTTTFSSSYVPPEVRLSNTTNAISFTAQSESDLDRVNLWVNDCPIWGQRGVSLRTRSLNTFDTTMHVVLSAGLNKIEVSVLNADGIENYRTPIYIYNDSGSTLSKVYFVGIGIDHFADPHCNLTWSSKDIRDMCAAMKEKYDTNFILVDTLFNQNVTVENVQAIKAKLMNTTVNDRVIIAYSGHGLLSDNYDYYLSTYNVNFHKPEENGLAYEELENLVDSIPARQKLMLIDACHSGEVDKEEMLKLKKAESDTSLHLVTNGKGFEVDAPDSSATKLGAQNSFELMSTLFVNVSRGTGTTVIAAASGTQFAYENGTLKNGVFTYCFLETMRTEKTCTVQQMKAKVSTRVTTLTNGLQRPTSRTETSGYDWVLW